MPNGGVPINMLLKPSTPSEYVVRCHGAELSIMKAADLQAGGAASAVLTLDREETLALVRFLRHWLPDEGSRPGDWRSTTVDCAYDF